MNSVLQKIFSVIYTPEFSPNVAGASSVKDTQIFRDRLEELFNKHNIKSMFDAGCNNCNWMKILSQYIDYKGGDISMAMVAHVWLKHPELDVILHDVTTDPIPNVELLFVRDVAIHLDHTDKKRLWQNWFDSNVPWILITHSREIVENEQLQYCPGELLIEKAHWEIAPWNFPTPVDIIDEYGPDGKCMALWNRNQFIGIL